MKRTAAAIIALMLPFSLFAESEPGGNTLTATFEQSQQNTAAEIAGFKKAFGFFLEAREYMFKY
ncbi:MAG: hypothetical protein OEV34_04850 [Gammaproteobacteria bacterium]|jgi:hypothetical protein|nr:hypothetical protein [Gammaproteobacteria bacterium]